MLRKFDISSFYICPPHLYTVATLPWEMQKSFFDSITHGYFRLFTLFQKLLRHETPHFISRDKWPANSPDLNSVHYRVWGMLQGRVYRVPIRDTYHFRKRFVVTWAEFQHSVADNAVDQWRKRLEACIRTEGGHLEHLL